MYEEILGNPRNFPNFSIENRLITRSGNGEQRPVVVLEGTYKRNNIHKTLGHLGPKKMMEYLHHYFWWKSMSKDTEKLCNSCGTCQTTKRTTRRQLGLLHPLLTLETPWSSIAMDFTGPFPTSLGYDYLWVIICRLTSTVHLIPIRTTSNALELAFVFICKVVRFHGLPTSIISDQDSKSCQDFGMNYT